MFIKIAKVNKISSNLVLKLYLLTISKTIISNTCPLKTQAKYIFKDSSNRTIEEFLFKFFTGNHLLIPSSIL